MVWGPWKGTALLRKHVTRMHGWTDRSSSAPLLERRWRGKESISAQRARRINVLSGQGACLVLEIVNQPIC